MSIPIQPGTNVPAAQHAMAILLPEIEEAHRVAAALDEVRRAEGPLAVIAVPPLRGLAFFADLDRQEKLDRWWSHAIPKNSQPVYLLRHDPGIVPWLPGLDGRFIIGAPSPSDARLYAAMDNVTMARSQSGVDIAIAAAEMFAGTAVFRDDAAVRLQHRLGRSVPTRSNPRFRRARIRPADEVVHPAAGLSAAAHPIPNVPAPDAAAADPAEAAWAVLDDDAGRDDLVRALAETLRRLQEIRSSA